MALLCLWLAWWCCRLQSFRRPSCCPQSMHRMHKILTGTDLFHCYPMLSDGLSQCTFRFSAAATTTEAPKTDVLGDINDDQNVTISDLVLLNRYLLRKIDGTDAAYAFDRGDVNGDKILNIVDATLYRQHLLGTLKKFPAE